ncbi:MAG TPA: AMP-binding protein [Acidimicrobiales bacterium]|nr:AMP-binding protein [Acidimicrobiales bacterium]
MLIRDAGTFWELIERRAELDPGRRMLVDEQDRELTFGQLRDDALRVAAGLVGLGVGPGSPVSWQLPTRIDTVVVCAALCRIGAVQNPVIHLYRERELGFAMAQTGATHLVVPGVWRGTDYAALAERAGAERGVSPQLVVLDQGLPEADPAALDAVAVPAADDSIRWIYYTSGTTSDPKGVCHTDGTLMAGGWGMVAALGLTAEDVGTVAFPIAHIGGADMLVGLLMTGGSAVMVEAFNPPESLALFRRHDVTMFGGGPAFYLACLNEQRKDPGSPVLPRLRIMSGGGAPKPPELHYEVMREIGGRGVVHGYGMTESPMIASGTPDDTDDQLANTEGRPVEGAEIRVVRTDGSEAAPGQEGEVRVRGPMVFKRYTDPELTGAAFDEKGFFRTGDLGRLRPDGHLTLTGRLKDVIIRKGENISAREIEDLLYEHPKVLDVAVIGLPDPERGERVCAVVQANPGEAPLEFTEMVGFLKEAGLMIQKIPEQLMIRDEMPRNSTGKIVKNTLREEYASTGSDRGAGAGS